MTTNKYLYLSQVPNWRKILSNFWVAPFESGGLKWNSVEHMYQGYKINVADPQKAGLFSLNSGSELSRGGGEMARQNRKMVPLSPDQLRQWNGMIDGVMYTAMYAKFSQNPDMKQVLLLTQDAELWHGAPRIPKTRQYPLEQVRAQISIQEHNMVMISYNDAFTKMQAGEAVTLNLDPKLDVLAEGNRMIVLTGKDGQKYIFKAGYDTEKNQTSPPT